jgi:hypothetical protein
LSAGGAAIVVARGPRRAEAELLTRIALLQRASAADADALALPVRVVVPSASLRQHVSAVMVRRFGALVGVRVQTLFAVAHEILERAGERLLPGRLAFPILVRSEARKERALAALEELREGYGAVAASVADLLDAGLDGEGAARLAGRLAAGDDATARAAALVRTAGRVHARLAAAGLAREGETLLRATAALGRNPALLPARALLVHGFADATGAASELICALLAATGGALVLDEPADPASLHALAAGAEEPADAGVAFSAPFRARVERACARVERSGAAAPARTRPLLLRGAGTDTEVRGVALRIAALLDGGVRPEGIGVVTRALEPYAIAIRSQFARMGVPFSGFGARAPRGPAARRAQALLELVRRGGQAQVDTWLEALAPRGAVARSAADVRVAAHVLGRARIGSLGALADDDERLEQGLALPVRRGFEADEAGEVRARRHRLRGDLLRMARDDARALAALLDGWPSRASAGEHAKALRDLAHDRLGWREEEALEPLARLELELAAPGLELSRDDVALALAALLDDASRAPLGGEGGGVQVLDVTEARARTFEHLFVLGLERDVFPRIVAEDPLLPDAVRRELLPLVPALAMKRAGLAEERFLFAELLDSSPDVVLSWRSADDDGRARSASPLVERMVLDGGCAEPRDLPSLHGARALGGERPAAEHAALAGLYGERADLGERLACAFEEQGVDPAAARELAGARVRILDEIDPDRRTPDGARRARELGPYFGFLGRTREAADPRRAALYVTTLEKVARCGWQGFLQRALRVEAPPDALGALPDLDVLLIGNAVHGALESIARQAGVRALVSIEEAVRLPAIAVAWPDAERVRALLELAATEAARDAGIELPGFGAALAELAAPYLEAAHRVDWSAPLAVLGVEIEGRAQLGPGADARAIGFKADRVDRAGGVVRLTDYKTGGAVADLAKAVRQGERLQAAAYRLASAPEATAGRFLYLRPDLDDARRSLEAGPDTDAAFREAAGLVLRAWDLGTLVPRLVDAQGREPRACGWCEVAEACARGDSGARSRLRAWAARRDEASAESGSDVARALLELPDARPVSAR